MRVLAFCPTLRLEYETCAFLLRFRLQVQRGQIPTTCSFDILLTTDNPKPFVLRSEGGDEGRANTLHNYRKGRRMALEGGYDRMFILESDMIPPVDALAKLSRLLDSRQDGVKPDVAYGLYSFRPRPCEKLNDPKYRLITNVYERPRGGNKVMEPGQCPSIGSSFSLKGSRYAKALKQRIVPCSGGGLGIVLMERRVIEEVDYRDEGRNGAFCDVYWNKDVWRAGFQQWADMSVVCGHKMPNGKVIWPPQRDMKIRATRSFSGRGFTHAEGDVFDDPRGADWVKAGLAEEVEEDNGEVASDDDLSTMTKAELYEIAVERDITGRGSMSKGELLEALS